MDIAKRKHRKQKLRDSPDVLAGIIGSAMDAIIALDESHRIVVFNTAAEKMFGCPTHEAIGSSIKRFIPQPLRAKNSVHVRRSAASGISDRTSSTSVNMWGLRTTGEELPIEASVSQIEARGKKFLAVAIRDLTERQRREEAVRESEQRFRLVADSAPVLLWMSDTDKLCTYFNKPWLEFTGRSLESELGNGWAEGVHREDWQRCMNTYTQAFDRREQFKMEYRLRRYDGEYRWILDIGVPRLNQDGSFAGYIGIALDVTERKLAEEKLREYEKAVEGLEEMIVVVDREYRYLIANRRFLNARKMTREQVEGRFANEVLNKGVFETIVKEKLDECFRGKIVRFEMKYSYPELGERDVLISYFPIEGDNGIDRVACIFQDITDRKRAEEALSGISRKLIEAQEQERVRIARELHDDIGQRLSLVSVALDQVQRDLPGLSSEARGQMDDVQQQIGEISTDVQSLSHELHSSKLEYLGLEKGMRSWCKAFGDRQEMEIDFRSHDVPVSPPPEISLCLFRVLQEAVHNAVKHSGTSQAQVQLGQTSGEIHLIVTDFGRGFDMEAAMQGQGLGLTSMRERVRLVNGAIIIQTKPMGGTTIHVRVPFMLDEVSERAAG